MLRKAFDGEVYYWYEDGKSRQAKSRVEGVTCMTTEKDKANVDPLRFVNAKVYTRADLDAARQQARAEAFKDEDLIDALKLLAHPKFATDDKGHVQYYVTKSDIEFARALLARVDAAAKGDE